MILKPLHVNINLLALAKEVQRKYQFVILENMLLQFILAPTDEYSPFPQFFSYCYLHKEFFVGNFMWPEGLTCNT